MNVISMVHKVHFIANPVVRESSLPYLSFAANDAAEFVRVSAFDQLDRALKGYVTGRRQQEMNVFGHNNERVQLVPSLATISVKRFQEKADVGFHDEQPPALPCREGHKISSGRGDESSRFQSKPQRLEAASFAETKSARVELVPFPVIFVAKVLVLGKGFKARYILPNGGHSALNVATTRSLSSNRWIRY